MVDRTKQHANSRDDWETPGWFFDRVQGQVAQAAGDATGFTLDAAATSDNALCGEYLDARGEYEPWLDDGWTWFNPPYTRKAWFLGHAHEQWRAHKRPSVGLLPSSTDTVWFHDLLLEVCDQAALVIGRLQFTIDKERPKRQHKHGKRCAEACAKEWDTSGNTSGSALVVFGPKVLSSCERWRVIKAG